MRKKRGFTIKSINEKKENNNFQNYRRQFANNWIRRNVKLIIGFASVLLIMLWMIIFIKNSKSFVINMLFIAMNTIIIVYIINNEKSKENVNTESVILISSIIFCCLCCFMEIINKLTLPFIILSLLIMYLLYFLKTLLVILNVNFWFLLLIFTITMILGLMTKNILIFIFKTITSEPIYKNFIINNKKEEDSDKRRNIIKSIINNDIFIHLIFYLSVNFVINKSDKLLEIELVRRFSEYLFNEQYMYEIIFTRGAISLFIVAILSIITIVVQKLMKS